MEHAPKAQKKEYFLPGATYFMNRFFMLGHSSLKFTRMALPLPNSNISFLSIEVKPKQMRKNNNEHKKIKQTYVISLCIIACQRIWSEIKKRKKKTNMTSE